MGDKRRTTVVAVAWWLRRLWTSTGIKRVALSIRAYLAVELLRKSKQKSRIDSRLESVGNKLLRRQCRLTRTDCVQTSRSDRMMDIIIRNVCGGGRLCCLLEVGGWSPVDKGCRSHNLYAHIDAAPIHQHYLCRRGRTILIS